MYAHILRIFILSAVFNKISSQTGCNSFKKCGTCISYAAERCVWCAAPRDIFNEVRCQPMKVISQNKTWCVGEGYIKNPDSKIAVVKSEELRNGTDKVGSIQLQPQEIEVTLRPGVPATFNFTHKPAKHYPLDVYYLMDFSFTMYDHFTNLKKHYQKIYKNLTSFTNNVRLGLGSFVEKPGFPYADPAIHNSYIFKNHISLTDNMIELEKETKKLIPNNTANYDGPEAILDALMQTIVCSEVKWREEATRIIVTSTDGTYHSAGDGKMVGAVIPNDMKCHNDTQSALLYDYPSVSQMNFIAYAYHTKIIFAVLPQVKNEYEALSKQIFGSEYIRLNNDTDIVKLIVNAYLNTRNTLKLSSESSDNVIVTFDPSCGNTDDPKKDDCDIKHKGNITVNVTLTATSCSPPETIRIRLQGLMEHIKIKVTVDCQCDCEKDGEGTPNSENCEHQGLEQCGVCTKCNKDRSGEFCKCNGTDTSSDLHKCMTESTDICSKRGECVCGSCDCYDDYHGDFCEYDGKECSPPGLPQCSGHGDCRYGKCDCIDGWKEKKDCSCSSDTRNCMNSDKVCSGNGVCECNQCKCDATSPNITYSGKYCECADRGCDALSEYVLCSFNNKENNTVCGDGHIKTRFVNRTELNSEEWQTATFCKSELANGSLVVFRYGCRLMGDREMLHVIIQDEANIVKAASIWIVLGSTIAAILLIGLLTILAWKCLVDMYDAREYKKFEKESRDAGFDVGVNPHYKEPQMKFSNPTFNSRCD